MANNNISWLGNPVVDGTPARNSTYAANYYPSSTSQDQSANYYAQPQSETAVDPPDQQGPPPISDPGYVPYFLASNIGKNVRAEFVMGDSFYLDKTGRLVEVGINYFVLEDFVSKNLVMCDLYSVRFVTIS